MTTQRDSRFLLVAAALLSVTGCQRGSEPPKGAAHTTPEPVLVFAAASTREAVEEIAAGFTNDTKTVVNLSADDSSKLALQISKEAPAHLFLSANEKWADFVKEKGFTHETKVLLGNSLVIVVPKGNPAGVKQPEDLTNKAVQRIGIAGPTVPAGIYARQALKKLKVWDGLQESKKVVSGDSVRIILTYVERGEVEAGVVYVTDAKITSNVDLVYTFDPSVHEPIRYPLVLLKGGQDRPAARAFFARLQTPSAGVVFKKYGFTFLGGQ